jgi:nickel-dependent lactate racemase
MNGFGGGGKILFPGVADFDSILEHHLKYTFHEGTGLGNIKGNLFYEQVCAIARSAKLNYVINSILDQNDQVYDLVSGDPVQAHLAGIQKSKAIISKKFSRRSDLTLITSFPYSEGPQIVKPLVPASMVTKEGGCIILAADCTGNLPDAFVDSFERFHSKYCDNLLGGVLEHFENNRLIMEGGAIDFNMALGLTLAAQHKFKIILVSEDIPRQKGEKMGFIFAKNLEEAFELSVAICPPHPEVHIIPSGGIILPVV